MKRYIRSDSTNDVWYKINRDGRKMWEPYINEILKATSDCAFTLSESKTTWSDNNKHLIFDVTCNGDNYGSVGILDSYGDVRILYDGYRKMPTNSIESGIKWLVKHLHEMNNRIIEDQKKLSVKTKNKSRSTFLLCLHCIDAIRSRGDKVKVYKGQIPEDMLREPTNAEIRDLGLHDYDLVGKCVWCEEVYPEDDLRRASF